MQKIEVALLITRKVPLWSQPGRYFFEVWIELAYWLHDIPPKKMAFAAQMLHFRCRQWNSVAPIEPVTLVRTKEKVVVSLSWTGNVDIIPFFYGLPEELEALLALEDSNLSFDALPARWERRQTPAQVAA